MPVRPVGVGGGYLTITEPWPAMLRGIWGDPERYAETYWSRFPGRYFAGDGAKIDHEGYLWLLGRVDDVMNVSGHRISTTEVESALVDHAGVAEAAVVGASDPTTGQAIVGYVIVRGGVEATDELREEIRSHVATKLGAIARPRAVIIVPDLPKTRSGKIMRRLLRDVVEHRTLGDTTTLADESVVQDLSGTGRRRRQFGGLTAMVWLIVLGVAVLALLAVTIYDLTQTRHSILRNYPVIGHLRFILEAFGPELRQYIMTNNDEERPFSRDERRWIYTSAKNRDNTFGFGTDNTARHHTRLHHHQAGRVPRAAGAG